jgi:hypothetical protein
VNNNKMNDTRLAAALTAVFISPNEPDRNLVPANIVDAIAELARSIRALAAALDDGSDR